MCFFLYTEQEKEDWKYLHRSLVDELAMSLIILQSNFWKAVGGKKSTNSMRVLLAFPNSQQKYNCISSSIPNYHLFVHVSGEITMNSLSVRNWCMDNLKSWHYSLVSCFTMQIVLKACHVWNENNELTCC